MPSTGRSATPAPEAGSRPAVELVPYGARWLEVVRPWFRHPEVDRWLGGPDLPARELLSDPAVGEEFRGRIVLRTHSWIALDVDGAAVAKIGGDVYDRWCRWGGASGGSSSQEPGPAFGVAYLVDPGRWRQGFGVATLRAVVAHPEVADVRVFAAGVEARNIASARCALAAGWRPDRSEPDEEDEEDIVHHVLRRPAQRDR